MKVCRAATKMSPSAPGVGLLHSGTPRKDLVKHPRAFLGSS